LKSKTVGSINFIKTTFLEGCLMRDELESLLYTRYAELYGRHGNSGAKKAMYFGFEHNDGWFSILDALSTTLVQIDPQARVKQVKEKFATLRFYASLDVKAAQGAIDAACQFSARVCEVTGRPGELYVEDWWYYTLSPEGWAQEAEFLTSPRRSVPVDKSGRLAAKLGYTKDEAISALRERHPRALINTKEIDFPPKLFDLVDVAVHKISQPWRFKEEMSVVKIAEIYWNAVDGLIVRPSFWSVRPLAMELIEADRKRTTKPSKMVQGNPLTDLVTEISEEISAVALFALEMAKRIDFQSGRSGPVLDDGSIMDMAPSDTGRTIDHLESTKQVIEVLASFESNHMFQPTIFPRKVIKPTFWARQSVVRLIKDGTIKVLLPKIYSQDGFFTPEEFPPSPVWLVRALVQQYGWQVVMPVEMSQFFFGKASKPNLNDIHTFYYDQPADKHFDKLNLIFKPVKDKRLLTLNAAGQVIWSHANQHPPITNKELLRDAAFAATAWFSEPLFLRWLTEEVKQGRLHGQEVFLAQAVMTAASEGLGLSQEAPVGFDPSDHEAEATRVYGWWLREGEGGSTYLAAHRLENHPHISDGRPLAHSTALVWYDEAIGWARTRSRFYRLIGGRVR
jgi:hypothetical protein